MTRLNNCRIKIVDKDITENTCWKKCYTYVVTKNVTITEGVLLKIEDGVKVYLVNDYLVGEQEQLRGGLFFDKARLCAKHLWVSSVNYDGQYYYPSKYSDGIKDNFGVVFKGTKDSSLTSIPTPDSTEELPKLDEQQEECLSKFYLKCEKCYTKCLYKLESLTLSYVAYLGLSSLESNELCVKDVNLCNLYAFVFAPLLSLFNSSISLCNLKMQQYGLYSNLFSFIRVISLRGSNLTIKESIVTLGLFVIFALNYNTLQESVVYLQKGVKLNVQAVRFVDGANEIHPTCNNLCLEQTPFCKEFVNPHCLKLIHYKDEPF